MVDVTRKRTAKQKSCTSRCSGFDRCYIIFDPSNTKVKKKQRNLLVRSFWEWSEWTSLLFALHSQFYGGTHGYKTGTCQWIWNRNQVPTPHVALIRWFSPVYIASIGVVVLIYLFLSSSTLDPQVLLALVGILKGKKRLFWIWHLPQWINVKVIVISIKNWQFRNWYFRNISLFWGVFFLDISDQVLWNISCTYCIESAKLCMERNKSMLKPLGDRGLKVKEKEQTVRFLSRRWQGLINSWVVRWWRCAYPKVVDSSLQL